MSELLTDLSVQTSN